MSPLVPQPAQHAAARSSACPLIVTIPVRSDQHSGPFKGLRQPQALFTPGCPLWCVREASRRLPAIIGVEIAFATVRL